MPIRELVYMSEARPDITDDDIANIVETCRKKNKGRDITGLLVYAGGVFVQILEGEEATVGTLFDSIATDARHHDAEVISDQIVDQRRFPKWSMGFIETDPAQIGHRIGMAGSLNRSELLKLLGTSDDFASKVLWSFVEAHDLEAS